MKYATPEERIAAQRAQQRAYYQKNKDKFKKLYYAIRQTPSYKKKQREYLKKYRAMRKEEDKNIKARMLNEVTAYFAEQIKYWNNIWTNKLADMEKRLEAVEKENKDILADIEEVLKDNKQVRDLVMWGKNAR